jgi:hypothetical protein
MKQTFEDYCRQLKTEADALAQEAEMQSRFNHLQAFNFGRTVGRMEDAREALWLRLHWLLLGVVAGVALGAVGVLLSGRIG